MKNKMYILLCAVVGLLMLSSNTVMAQRPNGERPQKEQVETLTENQTKTVKKILANYKSESLTAEDAKAIMKKIREAKIPGGKGVEKVINEAGFDFEAIKKLAPPSSRPKRGSKKR